MAISLTGSPGGIFRRWGLLIGLLNNVNGFRGGTAPDTSAAWGSGGSEINDVEDAVNAIAAQYQSAQRGVTDGIFTQLASYRAVHGSFLSYLQQVAQATVIEQANADTRLPAKTLANALALLFTQMLASSDSVEAQAITTSAAAATGNTGDGVVTASAVDRDGLTLETSFGETIDFLCTQDAGTGATAGREPFTATGDAAEQSPLSQDWPRGSNCAAGFTALDASSTSSNLLANGGFDTFTVANTPDSFTVGVGTPGTDIFSAGSSYAGANALKFTGTGGSPLSEIYQAVTLRPNVVYAFNCWLKKTTSLAAGVLQVALHDGSSVITDDASTNNASTKTLSALTTSYVAFSGYFRTPKVLPAVTRLRLKATTALTSGESVFIDHLCLAPASQLYTMGPWAAVFSGATRFARNDLFTLTVGNSGSAEFVRGLERLLGLRGLGLKVPSSGSPTIADTLIL